jgi:hypothetical protein
MAEGRVQLEKAVGNLNAEVCLILVVSMFMEGVSDKLIHRCVEGEDYKSCVLVFTSSNVQDFISKQFDSIAPLKIEHFLATFWDNPGHGAMTRMVFEVAVHQILRRGGSFKRKKVWKDKNREIVDDKFNLDPNKHWLKTNEH